jgi:hypothetical protein
MVSIEAFSGIIVALIVSSIFIGVGVTMHIEIYGSSRRPKLRILLFIISIVATLAVTGLAVLYYYGVNEYIDIAENDNGVILSRKTSCDVVELYTVFDNGYNKIDYIAWYTYRNSTRYYYHGICNGQVNCWPAVGDLINCWPVVEDSTVVAYVINPPLIDVGYYRNHREWAIAQLIISVLLSISMIVDSLVIIDKQLRNSQIEGEHNPNLDLINLGGMPVNQRDAFMELEGVQVNVDQPAQLVSNPSSQYRPPPPPITVIQANSGPKCVICLTNLPTIMYCRCLHVCICDVCVTRYNDNKCPICSQISSAKVKVFFP